MQESSVYQYLERTLRAELEVEVRAELEAEAREVVEREYAVKNILNILELRFQTPAVQVVKPALERIDAIEQLNQLVPEAIQAATLEVFMESLVRNGNAE